MLARTWVDIGNGRMPLRGVLSSEDARILLGRLPGWRPVLVSDGAASCRGEDSGEIVGNEAGALFLGERTGDARGERSPIGSARAFPFPFAVKLNKHSTSGELLRQRVWDEWGERAEIGLSLSLFSISPRALFLILFLGMRNRRSSELESEVTSGETGNPCRV